MLIVIMRLKVISAIKGTVNNLRKNTIKLAAPNLHFSILIFNNMTSIKRVNSFKHIAVYWLKCKGFL
jgi:hypothetical protein